MAIAEKEIDGKKHILYQQPSDDEIYACFSNLAETLKRYVELIPEIDFPVDIELNEMLIGEAVVRIDKRRDYFAIFHDKTEINEIKEAALWAYWVLKFKPIRVKQDTLKQLAVEDQARLVHINESFAFFLIFSAVKAVAKKRKVEFKVHQRYIEKINYAFRYWHLNKSALMLIAESLCAHMDPEE